MLENAIEVFIAVDEETQAVFLDNLRALGEESGNGEIKFILNDFAEFLETQARGMEPGTGLRYALNFLNNYFLNITRRGWCPRTGLRAAVDE